MSVYLDTSVLVSLYVPERHTASIMHFLAEADGAIFISRLVETEFYATLSKKKRTKELGSVKIASILKTFTKHIADGAFVLQPMTDQVFSSANTILRDMKSSLRTLDALHLAASKVARCELVTADKILAESAEMYKVPVRLI